MAALQSPQSGRLALPISSNLQNPSRAKSRAAYPSSSSTSTAADKLWKPRTMKSGGLRVFHRRATVNARRVPSTYTHHYWVERAAPVKKASVGTVVCGLEDFIGGDLLGFDLDQWEADVENHKAIALYAPHEGGYEGRYATRLKARGYHFLDLTARGLGDVEAYLSKVHGVRPPHLGKQKIVRWYYPPEVDYRLSLLPENSKGLILWLIEAKVLSKSELQYLALLPTLQPKVKVIAECGTWRKVRWKPLREIAGLDLPVSTS
eukprot:c654_g1_i1 orf=527-1312(-)